MGTVVVPSFGADPVTVTGPTLDAKVDGLATEFNGSIDNDNIKAGAAIAYSKLTLTGLVRNTDVKSDAAIVDTKLDTISTAGKVNLSALVITSQAQGDIIYASSASVLSRLGVGTDKAFLQTQGAAANPQWVLPATAAEVLTGTDDEKPVVSSTVIGHQGVIKGWIVFNGSGVVADLDSYNVSGIVDNGEGVYTISWDTDFASVNYALFGMCQVTSADDHPYIVIEKTTGKAVGSVKINTVNEGGVVKDPPVVSLTAIGDR